MWHKESLDRDGLLFRVFREQLLTWTQAFVFDEYLDTIFPAIVVLHQTAICIIGSITDFLGIQTCPFGPCQTGR